MIEGVKVKQLKMILDDRGRLMEMLRADDAIFKKFGQTYITTAKPGVVKGWHYHKVQTDHFICVRGEIRLGLYDARKDSPTFGETQDFRMALDQGPDKRILVQIPPYVYHGFKAISDAEAFVINMPTEPYNHKSPDEYRLDAYDNDIPFDWRKD